MKNPYFERLDAAIDACPMKSFFFPEKVKPAQIAPRIGDEFTLDLYTGAKTAPVVTVLRIEGDTVHYQFMLYYPQVSFCTLQTFVAVYNATPETLAARERGLSLDDYHTFVRDQDEMARDEARRFTHDTRDFEAVESAAQHEREAKRGAWYGAEL